MSIYGQFLLQLHNAQRVTRSLGRAGSWSAGAEAVRVAMRDTRAVNVARPYMAVRVRDANEEGRDARDEARDPHQNDQIKVGHVALQPSAGNAAPEDLPQVWRRARMSAGGRPDAPPRPRPFPALPQRLRCDSIWLPSG